MSKSYRVRIWNDTGIPDAMKKYCEDNSISMDDLAIISISEKLSRMDIHSMTVAEIEQVERGADYE